MKKTKFSILFILAFTLFGSFSCKKKSDDSSADTSTDFFVRFKVNGVQKEFKGTTTALFQTIALSPTLYTASFQGIQNSTATSTNVLGLNVSDIAAIAVNKNYTSTIVGSTIQASILYFDQAGAQYGSIFVTSGSSTDAVIRLTEITSTSVSGTFSGKVASSTGSNNQTITEGSFRVKRM